MDFFTAQEKARRNTGRLVFFFVLAVISLIILTNLLLMVIFAFDDTPKASFSEIVYFDWNIFFIVSGIVLAVVIGGTLYKISKLSRGGDAVAAMFGAKPVFGDDPDLDIRKLVNIVEEMAIASGTPVPQVYLLEESGINAFAAGFTTSDAIIAVTRGAVRHLNREQLQGVVAHEFSHILNGDMRLNVKLVGILHGILLIGLIGGRILSGSGRSRRSGLPIILLGLGLLIIGYAGTFFGNLIKAAVSRQREFLADAAAVQFTRNPDGIGGALLQIGGNQNGSQLLNPRSKELSHALFGQGVKSFFIKQFATHPPLPERIKRILPGWDGNFPEEKSEEETVPPGAAKVPSTEAVVGLTGSAIIDQIGRPESKHLVRAQEVLRNIEKPFLNVASNPFKAQAIILYLALDKSEEILEKQLNLLKKEAALGIYPEFEKLVRAGTAVKKEQRFPLIEMALPALRRLSEEESQLLLKNLNTMISADARLTLFEWCLYRLVSQYVEDFFKKPAQSDKNLIPKLEKVKNECSVVLTMLVKITKHEGLQNSTVFQRAATEMELKIKPTPFTDLSLSRLDKSLIVLRRLTPQAKGRLMRGFVTCVEADGRIDPLEYELLRTVAATLAIPMPPLSGDQQKITI